MTIGNWIALASTIIGALGLMTTIIVHRLNKMEKRREAEAEERKAEEARIKKQQEARYQARLDREVGQDRLIGALVCLCEANAIATQNGATNGETHRALTYVKKVKHENKDFMRKVGIEYTL